MDFIELEAIEGLRWPWNSFPTTPQSSSSSSPLLIPLSVLYTPLTDFAELPQLNYEPLICRECDAVLNPYSSVDYTSRIWTCAFCYTQNSFPKSYDGVSDHNLPAELFPTYSTVEYVQNQNQNQSLNLKSKSKSNLNLSSRNSSPRVRVSGSCASFGSCGGGDGVGVIGVGAGFVFVVDLCIGEEEIGALKRELLLVLTRLPENALVGLVTFDGMVQVRDVGYSECSRVVVFHGNRELSSEQVVVLLTCDGNLIALLL